MSNLNSLKKSDLIALVEQLERNADDDRRRIGVMMYEANVLAQRVNELEAEVESLQVNLSIAQADLEDQSKATDEYDAELTKAQEVIEIQAERIKILSRKVAAQPKSAPPTPKPQAPVAPKPPSPQPMPSPAYSEYTQVVQVTDADRAVWAKFKALPREQRLEIINWARPQFGNVGIDNIIAVRQAWHESKQAAA